MTPLLASMAFLGIEPTVAVTAVVIVAGLAFTSFILYLAYDDDHLTDEPDLDPVDD